MYAYMHMYCIVYVYVLYCIVDQTLHPSCIDGRMDGSRGGWRGGWVDIIYYCNMI